MHKRQYKQKEIGDTELLQIMGVNINKLYGKTKTQLDSNALLKNIFKPSMKETNDIGKYKNESYNQLVHLVTTEPINGKYISVITDELSDFIKDFQRKQSVKLKTKRIVPIWFLPVINTREYDFNLKNYHIGYCLEKDKLIRPHRWQMSKQNAKLTYTCRFCNLIIDNANASENKSIQSKLEERMIIQAFFELYMISCPVKDAHVFEKDTCTKCTASKSQLASMDMKYYKKYSDTYMKHRTNITDELLKEAKQIIQYAKPVTSLKKPSVTKTPDLLKLESLINSLSKTFNADFKTIATDNNELRSLQIIESYTSMFYSHYLFAKNISVDAKTHPDSHYFKLVKETFFNGMSLKSVKLPELPEYPQANDADILLTHLYEMIHEIMTSGVNEAVTLIQFIVNKMIQQDSRRKQFNFAKLKAVNTPDGADTLSDAIQLDEEEEEEFDIFDGYDISYDDMEDNIDGDFD